MQKKRRTSLSKPMSHTKKKTRKSLLEEYWKAKRARIEAGKNGAVKVGRVTDAASSPHSSVSEAYFADGKIKVSPLTDQGADTNLMSKCLLENVPKEMPSLQPIVLGPVQTYRGVTGDPCVLCKWEVKLDVFMRIWQGSNLILGNILWKVSTENIQARIMGRCVLDSLGCDNRKMLMAASDKYGKDIDVTE